MRVSDDAPPAGRGNMAATHAVDEPAHGGYPPEEGTLARWAWDYLRAPDLAGKFRLDAPPRSEEGEPVSRSAVRPTRPAGLVNTSAKAKTPGPDALRSPLRRATLVHTFLHHELQAAELMCWALLAFPDAPAAFRKGLTVIARDEVRHMGHYAEHLASLGHRFGDFPVRDWFWERVPEVRSPASFVATLGMGFEGGNLDHTARFAERFRAIGDEAGARLQELIFDEEIPHVRFATRWFRVFTGTDDFTTWARHLPPPLSPMLMKGHPLHEPARLRSGMSHEFVSALSAWQGSAPGF